MIQIGAPDTREQYVHRTGRTGRADKSGRALLLLAEWEEPASMMMLKGLPIERSYPSDADVDAARGEAARVVSGVDERTREKAYQAARDIAEISPRYR